MADFTFTVPNPNPPNDGFITRRFDLAHGINGLSVSQRGLNVMYIATDPPQLEVANRCEHCGRGDIHERIAHSIDQAVQYGWLIEVEK